MIYPWLNGAFWTLSRKRGVPANMIKGVLFFKISKKAPVKQRSRKCFASSIRGIGFLYCDKEEWKGSANKRSFFFQNLRMGGLFFKILEKEFCCCRNHWASEKILCLSWYLFVSPVWKGRGKNVYGENISHKRRSIFQKIEQHISSMYRCKLCAFETLFTR